MNLDALCIFVMKCLLATDKFKRGVMKFPVFVEIFVSASFIAYHHTVLEKTCDSADCNISHCFRNLGMLCEKILDGIWSPNVLF